MAITEADILVMASERLTDDTDGGGRMTATVVQSGVENNLFNDVSSVDRAEGALHLRKAFGWVNSAGHEALLGAHLILDDLADDLDVTAVIIPATGPADTRAQLIAHLNTPGAASALPFYGTKTFQVDAAIGDRTVQVDGIETQFIPLGASSTPVAGSVATGLSTVTGIVPAGATIALTATATSDLIGGGTPGYAVVGVDTQLVKSLRAFPGSFSGTGRTWLDHAGTIPFSYDPIAVASSSATGLLSADKLVTHSSSYFVLDDPFLHATSNDARATYPAGSIAALGVTTLVSSGRADLAGSYQPALVARVPREEKRTSIDSTNRTTVYVFNLPAATLAGSESIQFTSGGVTYTLATGGSLAAVAGVGFGTTDFKGSGPGSASINRFSGVVTLILSAMPDLDSDIVVAYGQGAAASLISSGALSGGGNFVANHMTVSLTAGCSLDSFVFYIGAVGYAGIDGEVYTGINIVGAYDKDTGVITLNVATGAVTNWRGIESVNDVGILSARNTLPPGLDPATIVLTGTKAAGGTFTSTANSTGAFSDAVVTGTYAPATGLLDLVFLVGVKAGTLEYTADQITYSTTGLDLGGLNPSYYPATGKVQVLRPLDLVVAHRTVTVAAATYANTNVVNIGEVRISRLRVINSLGVVIATFVYGATGPAGVGCHANLVAGTLTFDDVSGMSQPLTLQALIADMTTVSTVATDGTVKLSRALSHAYPIGSLLSSALLAGDTFSQVHDGWAQTTWTGVFSDSLIGSAPSADYNEVVNPIQVTNEGAITERWAIIFTGTTTFRVVGETVGEILTSSTGVVTAPLNPATLVPYFSIPAAGWASGWAIGNVYRFNTESSTFPFWVARTVMPSDQVTTVDSITVAVRGDIDNS